MNETLCKTQIRIWCWQKKPWTGQTDGLDDCDYPGEAPGKLAPDVKQEREVNSTEYAKDKLSKLNQEVKDVWTDDNKMEMQNTKTRNKVCLLLLPIKDY